MELKRLINYLQTREARNTAGTAGLMLFRKGTNSLLAIILAPALGAQSYGVYAFALSCLTILSVGAMVGLDRLTEREVARLGARGEFDLLRGIVGLSILIVAGASLIAGLVVTLGLWRFGEGINKDLWVAIFIVMAVLPFYALTTISQSVLVGLQMIILGQIPEAIVRPVIFILLCSGAILFDFSISGAGTVALLGLAALLGFAVAAINLMRQLPAEVRQSKPRYNLKPWRRSAVLLWTIGGLQVLHASGMPIMLGLLKDASVTGVFALTFALAQLVSFVYFAVDRPLAPSVAALLAKDDKVELQAVLLRLTRLSFSCALPVALIFVLAGGEMLRIFFGPDFAEGRDALVILVCGQVLNVAMGQPGVVLVMAGYEKAATKALCVRTGLAIFLSLVLIPPFGIEGAAFSFSASVVVSQFILVRDARRLVGLQTTILGLAFEKR